MMKLLKNNKGFTLVELIVVIVILGVLAGVGAPQIFKYVKNSRIAAIKSNCAMVESVVNNLYAEKGNYANAFGADAASATTAINGLLQNNKTLASMNITVTSSTAATKTIVLTIDRAKAGIDGDELGGTAPWNSTVKTADPTYTIVIQDAM